MDNLKELGHGKVWLEAVLMGVFVTLVGMCIYWCLKRWTQLSNDSGCPDWNAHYILQWTLFLSGAVGHLLAVVLGFGKKYCCAHGFDCAK